MSELLLRSCLHPVGALGLAILLVAGLATGFARGQSAPDSSLLLPVEALPDSTEDSLPFGAGTSYLLGTTLLEQGAFQEALPYLHHSYRLAPDVEEIATAYLSVLMRLGYGQQALTVLNELNLVHPDRLEYGKQRVILLAEMRRYERSLDELLALRGKGLPDDELLLLEARLLGQAERPEQAVAAYRRALTLLPDERERIYLHLAELLQKMQAESDLASLWVEATAALPNSRPLRFGWLRALVRQGRYDEAHTLASKADEAGLGKSDGGESTPAADSFSWELELADLLVKSGEVTPALDILRSRHSRRQLPLEATLWLARLLMQREDWSETLSILENAAAQWPDSGRVQFYLGDALAARGDWRGGESALRRAISLAPEEPDFTIALARLLTIRHSEALAAPHPDSTVTAVRQEIVSLAGRAASLIDPADQHGHMILGYALRAVKEFAGAVAQFQAASGHSEVRKEAMLQLAVCQDEMGQGQQARQTLETLRREEPGDANVANSLGYFLAERGAELTRAESLIHQALADDPDNGAYLDSLGWVFFKQKRFQEAFDLLVKAANVLPDDPTILEHLGLVLYEMGQLDEALRVLKRVRDLGGDPERLAVLIRKLEQEQDGR